jgi:triosephosphate isomerase
VIIGVSLKLYFGYAETLEWCRTVARLTGHASRHELFVLPTFPALPAVAEILTGTGIGMGAQNLSATDAGAFTGEVSGAVLAELGCRYVEVGHAERRRLFGEDEPVVAAKTAAALRNGLVPVLCLGEVDHGPADVAAQECLGQLESALTVVGSEGLSGRLLIAYEPHWAIGAAEPAGDDHIRTVCSALREALCGLDDHPHSAVIYGGSAGVGLLTRLAGGVDGLFLGRFAHDPAALAAVLAEVGAG